MAQYLESLELPKTEAHDTKSKVVDAFDTEAPQSGARRSWLATPEWVNAEVDVSIASYQAYQTLYFAFIALLAVAGLDKFLHLLRQWETYVSPSMASFFHLSTGAMTIVAGLIEITIAAAIALKPRYGSWAAMAWFGLIIINLLTIPGHYDMVLISAFLAAVSFAFTRLAAECN